MSPLNRILILATGSLALAACATVPQPLTGTFSNVTSLNAQQGGAGGAHVRWGGEIIKTEPGQQETCFYLLARPLDEQARPTGGSNAGETQGRFVACRAGFYDPEVFSRGREVTVAGTVHGTVTQKVGDYDYAYPRVEADVVYLWPRRQYVNSYPAYGYGPYWGPGPWGWGDPFWGGWGGYYGGPRVIVVRPPPPVHR